MKETYEIDYVFDTNKMSSVDYNTSQFSTLPCSPYWPETYENKDYQPDEEFSVVKREEFRRKMGYLLEISIYNKKLTKLEMDVKHKRLNLDKI